MRKTAIFVEGQTELIFVREFLLKWFDYKIEIECRNLFNSSDLRKADYDYSVPEPDTHFQVINVGMDGNVITRILDREQYLMNAGYGTIIGLRDMYSKAYRDAVQIQKIDSQITDKFRKGIESTIQKKAKEPGNIKFCFAIMEIEAWWLGIPLLWSDLSSEALTKYQTAFDEPESVFHPATMVDELFKEIGKDGYSKRKSDVESIVSQLQQEEYTELFDSGRVPSFCEFVQYVQS